MTETRRGRYEQRILFMSPKRKYSQTPFGALVAYETGEAVTYGLYNAQEGNFIYFAGKSICGMVVGQSPKSGDITVNVQENMLRI